LILVESFLEKDQDELSQWITLAPGMVIQAPQTERDDGKNLYGDEKTPSKYHLILNPSSLIRTPFFKDGEVTN